MTSPLLATMGVGLGMGVSGAESIEWFIENQAFFTVVWFGSSPHPLPPASCLFFSVFSCVACRAYWRERGKEGGGGAKTYDGEKAWSSIKHSILSGRSRFIRQLNSVGRHYFFLFYLGEQAMWKPVSSQRVLVYIWIQKNSESMRRVCNIGVQRRNIEGGVGEEQNHIIIIWKNTSD